MSMLFVNNFLFFLLSIVARIDVTSVKFLFFILAILANIILAVITLRYAPATQSRYLFILFLVAEIFWISTNYALFLSGSNYFLLLTRATVFFAAFHAFTFFLFIYSFLERKKVLTKKLLTLLLGILAFVLTIIASPYTFVRTQTINNELVPEVGWGIGVFGSFVVFCIGWAFISLFKKYRRAECIEKIQWKYLAIGLSLTFVLILTFSFFNFVLLGNFSLVQYGHLYTLPFIIFTGYAIVRHQLLNIKAIVAELTVFFLTAVLLVQFFTSENASKFIINGFITRA